MSANINYYLSLKHSLQILRTWTTECIIIVYLSSSFIFEMSRSFCFGLIKYYFWFNQYLFQYLSISHSMGRVRTKTIKRAAKVLLEKHYQKLTNDFHINKKILSEVAKVPTKSLRNKIAGFATHLVKRIQRGPVKGISLKVQEEERERRLDWVPKES